MSPLRHTWVLAVAGLLAVLLAGSIYWVTGQLGPAGQVFGVLGIAGLLAYGFLDREQIAAGASTREVFASASTAMVLVLGLVLAVLLGSLANRYDQTADLTRDGRFSLSERAGSVLDGLDRPVEIYGLFREGAPERTAFDRIAEPFAKRSANVTYIPIDPLAEPARVRALLKDTGNADLDRVAQSGAILLLSGDRRRRIESGFDQTRLTNAIVKLVAGDDRRVCWSVGQNERDPDDDQTVEGYGALVLRLEDRNVTISPKRLFTAGVDRACDALIIAGPRADFAPRTLEAIAAYVAEGGQVLMLLDNPLLEDTRTPTLDEDLARYGIAVADDVIFEMSPDHAVGTDQGDTLFLYGPPDFKEHPILRGLPQGVAVRWPRSVQASNERPGVEVRNLIHTTDRSWADRNVDPTGSEQPTPDDGEQLGPVAFMVLAEVLDPSVLEVAATAPAPAADTDVGFAPPSASLVPTDLQPEAGGRVMVLGDADVGGNALSPLMNNGDLLLGAIHFLLGEEEQLGSDEQVTEFVVLSSAQLALLFLIGVLIVPGAAAATGASLVIRRRFL